MLQHQCLLLLLFSLVASDLLRGVGGGDGGGGGGGGGWGGWILADPHFLLFGSPGNTGAKCR